MGVLRITMPIEENVSQIQVTVFNIQNFYQLLKSFETRLTQGIREIMISRGVEKTSDLVKSVDVAYSNDVFQILANDYYQAVSNGRKPKARKVPINALIKWIKEEKIPFRGSINEAAFAIQQAIYRKGIRGRLYQESVIDFSSTVVDEVSTARLGDWAMFGVVEALQQLEDGKWITVSVTLSHLKKPLTWEDIKATVPIEQLA